MVGSAAAPTLWHHELAACEPAADRVATAVRTEAAVRADLTVDRPRLERVAASGGPSLDRLITRLWEEITGHQLATCPWCEGEMRPQYGAASRPVAARCTDCGASLS